MGVFETLKPEKQKALLMLTEMIVNPDAPRRTYDEIAEACGISTRQLFRWRTQDKAFADARKELVEAYSDEIVSDAFAAIRYKLRTRKDMKAAELALRARGLLVDRKEVQADVNAKVESVSEMDEQALAEELAKLRAKAEGLDE